MPCALVVGAGLPLGGTDHISGNIDLLASAGAYDYRRGAGKPWSRRRGASCKARRGSVIMRKAAAVLIAEAVNKWICEQAAPQRARRRKSVTLSC
jgi:hypothetical protein